MGRRPKPRECHHQEVNLNLDTPIQRTIGGVVAPLKIPEGWDKRHDCDYVDQRNALIPTAEKIANKAVMELPGEERELSRRRGWPVWSRLFLEAMDRLWAARTA